MFSALPYARNFCGATTPDSRRSPGSLLVKLLSFSCQLIGPQLLQLLSHFHPHTSCNSTRCAIYSTRRRFCFHHSTDRKLHILPLPSASAIKRMSSCALDTPGIVLLLSLFEPSRDLTDTVTAHFHQLVSFVMLASHSIKHDIKCKLISLLVLFPDLPNVQFLMVYSTQGGRPGPFYHVDYINVYLHV